MAHELFFLLNPLTMKTQEYVRPSINIIELAAHDILCLSYIPGGNESYNEKDFNW